MVVSSFVKALKSDEAAVAPSGFSPKDFRDVFSRLTGGRSGMFFEEYWEKHPVFFDRQGSKDNFINESVFSRSTLFEIVDGMELPVDTNLSAVNYIAQSRQSWPFSSDVASSSEVKSIFKNSFTVQFFQPQRFADELHWINAGFEHVFGSLAGASAYLTPANSQGLAPHHDDVDVFVLQCEGSKTWNLWPNSMPLPEIYSHDIPRSSLPGPPTKVLMKQGDMLYLPRGTIHEALSQSKFSTHVTISVYQLYNMKKLLANLLPRLLDSAFSKDIELRRGLPLWMSDKLGSFAGLEESFDAVTSNKKNDATDHNSDKSITGGFQHSAWRRELAEKVRSTVISLAQEVSLSLLDKAADEITGDFVMHRLPPPSSGGADDSDLSQLQGLSSGSGSHMKESARNFKLTPSSAIKICDPRSMFCMVKEESGVSMLTMAHSKNNDRAAHMGHPSPFGDEEVGSEGSGGKDGEGEEKDEENEGGGDEDEGGSIDGMEEEEGEEEGFIWSVYLPLRLAPVIIALQRVCCSNKDKCTDSFSSAGISLQELQRLMEEKRIFADEVVAALGQLHCAGFVTIVNEKSLSPKKIKKNEDMNSPNSKNGKSVKRKVAEEPATPAEMIDVLEDYFGTCDSKPRRDRGTKALDEYFGKSKSKPKYKDDSSKVVKRKKLRS